MKAVKMHMEGHRLTFLTIGQIPGSLLGSSITYDS